ncbi:MAG: hypothetical protein QNL12_09925 [Acidimicrobiia bacterium]|nr:hypothetical protein [Acidimicrobiia bacterium]MDX2467622.1 hypothetical protein [Acidimicrobiia bacterium]
MTTPPRRRKTSWTDDARGGIRSIGLEAVIVVALGVIAVLIAWVAVTVV